MTDLASTPSRWRNIALWRVAVALALVLLLLGFASMVWTPYPVTSLDVGSAMQDPSGAHWLGTDQLGRDVLSLIMKGLLTSFVVAAVAVAVGALLGLPLGLAAAYWGTPGRLTLDGVDLYLTAAPAVVFAVLFALLLGPSAATVMLAAGAVPVFLLARKSLPTLPLLAPVMVLGYLLAPAVLGENLFDFHPVTLVTPLFLFAVLALTYRKYVWFVILCILAAACKEEMGAVVALLALVAIWKYRIPRLGAVLFVGGIVWTPTALPLTWKAA